MRLTTESELAFCLVSDYQSTRRVFSKCLLRHGVLRVFVLFCVGFWTGHFVMVPLNLIYLHCLQHSFFEHLLNLFWNVNPLISASLSLPTEVSAMRKSWFCIAFYSIFIALLFQTHYLDRPSWNLLWSYLLRCRQQKPHGRLDRYRHSEKQQHLYMYISAVIDRPFSVSMISIYRKKNIDISTYWWK